jgi:RNA polymerase sigma-70 factor, ECF subfamily
VIEQIYRAEWGRLLALLVARTRRLDLVEDALSEAFERAAQRWPAEGTPDNPAGWLYSVASRLVLGSLRTEAVAGRKAPLLAMGQSSVLAIADSIDDLPDERLQLILLCCHPALPKDSRSALALRLVIGTSTEEIARLFLVSTPTMAARLTRAKSKIVMAGIPLVSPTHTELKNRLDEVCRTIYLTFTVGYSPASGGEPQQSDLASEALQLATLLQTLTPTAPQVAALRGLLLLQHSRRDARFASGRLVTLAKQDRSLWHHHEIALGLRIIQAIEPGDGYAEELRLQALIAAQHALSATSEATNWTVIAARYGELELLTGSPIVRLNRAVAVAEAHGPTAGLRLLDGLDALIPGNHRVTAVRAELARKAGDRALARTSYSEALDLCNNEAERAHLASRLASLD